jgi:hypothetical protein
VEEAAVPVSDGGDLMLVVEYDPKADEGSEIVAGTRQGNSTRLKDEVLAAGGAV